MHAAPSVILFTVLSGAGFGGLAFLALGLPAVVGLPAFLLYGLVYLLAVGGLLASTFHLGQPRRALLAFTQWRTSWLSREAGASVVALTVTGAMAACQVFLGARPAAVIPMVGPLVGPLAAVLCLLTVYSSSMVYAQLATVPRWNTPLTPALFLAAALAGGSILTGETAAAASLLIVLGALQLFVWRRVDGRFAERGHTLASATGLGRIGRPRHFEPPHTGGNYLLSEFVHRVGRRHAVKLRGIGFLAMSPVPAFILLALPPSIAAAGVSLGIHLAGMTVSRWLFFAEAEHVTRLYYTEGLAP